MKRKAVAVLILVSAVAGTIWGARVASSPVLKTGDARVRCIASSAGGNLYTTKWSGLSIIIR